MKKLIAKEMSKECLDELQKRRRKIKFTSLLFALLTLGVNVFAWFVYVTNANLSLDATVASWDVSFLEDGVQTNSIIVDVTDMYPGMLTFRKNIVVTNKGEVSADFDYHIKSFTLLGDTYTVPEDESDGVIQDFSSKYPFLVKFSADKSVLNVDDSLNFGITVDWDYEGESTTYFQLDHLYKFDPTLVYYRLSGGSYIEDNTIDSTTYSANRDNLYLEKDDADCYFGTKCGEYKKRTGLPCFSLNMQLIVKQKRS